VARKYKRAIELLSYLKFCIRIPITDYVSLVTGTKGTADTN